MLKLIPNKQFLLNELQASEIKSIECNMFFIIKGLNVFNSKWPFDPQMLTVTLFPIT